MLVEPTPALEFQLIPQVVEPSSTPGVATSGAATNETNAA